MTGSQLTALINADLYEEFDKYVKVNRLRKGKEIEKAIKEYLERREHGTE